MWILLWEQQAGDVNGMTISNGGGNDSDGRGDTRQWMKDKEKKLIPIQWYIEYASYHRGNYIPTKREKFIVDDNPIFSRIWS